VIRFALLLALAGCGYTASRDHGLPRRADGTLPRIAVVPFDNETFRRGFEIELSRRLTEELRSRSARAPAAPGAADWLLTGSVVRATEHVLSEDRDDEVRESSFVITVRVVLEERATGKVLDTAHFTEREPFSDRAGRIATVEEAGEQAVRDLAENIVYWLEGQTETS
jgi:hypothetical protein